MNRKVSVIIPVYNRQEMVQECVSSILAQSYDNFEIILIDDGSTDRTLAVCHELAERDARIRVLEGQHGGVSAARNLGLEATTGEYVFFVDSDDAIHPELMGALVHEMEGANAGIAGTELLAVKEQNWSLIKDLMARANEEVRAKHLNNEEALHTVFYGTSPLSGIGGIMMVRDLVGETRFRNDLFVGEDWFFVYENLAKGADVVLLDTKWYFYHRHGSNTIRDCSFDAFYSRFHRRELVWKKEESFGRIENATHQKRDAMGVFFRHIDLKSTTAKDRRKMCRTIKKHKNELLPALTLSGKAYCFLAAYAPAFYSPAIYNAVKRLRNVLRGQPTKNPPVRTPASPSKEPSSFLQKGNEPIDRNKNEKTP